MVVGSARRVRDWTPSSAHWTRSFRRRPSQIGPNLTFCRCQSIIGPRQWPAAGGDSSRPGGTMIQQIERQFVRTDAAALRPSRRPARSGDRARRTAVGLARCRPSASSRSGCRSAGRPWSAPIASSSRAGCCAATSDAARSSAPRPSRQGRRSRGAARSPPRRCDRATRRCATSSAIRPTRGCCRSPPASRRSTVSQRRRFSEAVDHVLRTRCRRGVAPRADRRAAGAARARSPIATACRARACWFSPGAQQGLDLLARCLIDPGDAVIIDRPGYLGAIQSFRAAGAKLIGWDIARADSRRARGSARPLSAEADLHEPDVPEPDRRDAADPDAARAAVAGRALPRADRRGRDLSRAVLQRSAAAVAARARRPQPRHPPEQLLEGDGAGAAPRMDRRRRRRSSIRSRSSSSGSIRTRRTSSSSRWRG